MDVDLTNPTMWLSMLIGAAVLAAVSAFLQSQHEDAKPGDPLNTKAVARDAILGAIFTAMAWTLVPESMKSLTDSVSSSVTSAATTVTNVASEATKKVSSGADIDLQIGPARF
jgi:hypothetical protein